MTCILRQVGWAVLSIAPFLVGRTPGAATAGEEPATYSETTALGTGSSGEMKALAFSPDGKTAAVGGETLDGEQLLGVVRLWDVATEKLSKSLHHGVCVRSVAFDSRGGRLATAASELVKGELVGTVVLWDLSIGAKLATITGHSSHVTLAFSRDGQFLASGDLDATVKVWDVDAGRELLSFKGTDAVVTSLAFSPDSKTLVTGGGATDPEAESRVRVWEIASGKELEPLARHDSQVTSVAYSHNGRLFASTSADTKHNLKLLDTSTGTERAVEDLDGIVGPIAFAPDDLHVAFILFQGRPTVALASDPSHRIVLTSDLFHGKPVTSIAFSGETGWIGATAGPLLVLWRTKGVAGRLAAAARGSHLTAEDEIERKALILLLKDPDYRAASIKLIARRLARLADVMAAEADGREIRTGRETLADKILREVYGDIDARDVGRRLIVERMRRYADLLESDARGRDARGELEKGMRVMESEAAKDPDYQAASERLLEAIRAREASSRPRTDLERTMDSLHAALEKDRDYLDAWRRSSELVPAGPGWLGASIPPNRTRSALLALARFLQYEGGGF